MYRIFETESFLRSLEQNFGGQQEKIKNEIDEAEQIVSMTLAAHRSTAYRR